MKASDDCPETSASAGNVVRTVQDGRGPMTVAISRDSLTTLKGTIHAQAVLARAKRAT